MKAQKIAAVVVIAVYAALIALALLFPPKAHGAELDVMECAQLAGKFRDNPFALTVGEYDALAVCARTLQAAKVQAAENVRIDRAIQRNFGKDDE